MMPLILSARLAKAAHRIALIFCLACACARAQQLVFTTVTPGTCPIWVSAPERSKDFGYQSLSFLNDSSMAVQAIFMRITFSTGPSNEEIVDGGSIYVTLGPGEQKRQDVFLGRIEALTEKLKLAGQPVAWVKLTVTSADFEDGSRWEMEPVIGQVTK